MNTHILQAVIEGFVDGILILTPQGRSICTNSFARQICQKLNQDKAAADTIPDQIWRICQMLIDNSELHPDYQVTLEDEIQADRCRTIRIRVQWIDLTSLGQPGLLVALEDKYQSAQRVAIAESQRYQLTNRESEVWLLRRANYTYKEIAAQLFIAVDTVKKHMKSIHAKQQAFQWANE